MNEKNNTVGDVWVLKQGHSITFYSAVRYSRASVWLQELESKMVKNIDGYGQVGLYVPNLTAIRTDQKTIRKVMRPDHLDPSVTVCYDLHSTIEKWSGRPIYVDSCD